MILVVGFLTVSDVVTAQVCSGDAKVISNETRLVNKFNCLTCQCHVLSKLLIMERGWLKMPP